VGKIPEDQKQALVRGFAEGYEEFCQKPEVKSCEILVTQYTEKLKAYGLPDYVVAKRLQISEPITVASLLAYRCLLLFCWFVICVPSGLLALPNFVVVRLVARKQAAEAVKKSSVKKKGRDVMATWKVLVAMVFWPLLHLVYTSLVYVLYGEVRAVVFFFFMPFVSYLGLKAQENFMRLFRSIKPLALMLNNPKLAEELVELRETCREKVVHVVDEVGWGVPMDFKEVEKNHSLRLQRSSSFSTLFSP
jgi:glycerol-3-phosphate O-acyltransferase/dihydroxyacetone phosphate acyltransferase